MKWKGGLRLVTIVGLIVILVAFMGLVIYFYAGGAPIDSLATVQPMTATSATVQHMEKPSFCRNTLTAPTITKFEANISRYVSPDNSDVGFNRWSLNISFASSAAALDVSRLVLDVAMPYRTQWKTALVGRKPTWTVQTIPGGRRYTAHLTGVPPAAPGFYETLRIGLNFTKVSDPTVLNNPDDARLRACTTSTLASAHTPIDVTCSATIIDTWCNGERRWIPRTKRCASTYKPCGQETAVGVANANNCTRYACYNNNRTCGRIPIGGDACIECTPVSTETCIPNCNNAGDNSIRVCGDDGCGGICGPFGSGSGCNPADPSGNVSCDATVGVCVQPLKGACSVPYSLFGTNLAPGSPELNPNDAVGIQYFKLNNSAPDTTLPMIEILNASSASGWPVDGLTVPDTGIRVRIYLDSSFYQDSVTSAGNSVGTPDVSFKFIIPAGEVQPMDAYILGANGDCTDRDTYLVVVNGDCSAIESGQPSWHPADQFEADDSTPPGSYCSNVLAVGLMGGESGASFNLVATTYSASNAGPLWLEVVFTPRAQAPCVPICLSHVCGQNECGGMCNVRNCGEGLDCNDGVCSNCPAGAPANCLHEPSEVYPAPYDANPYLAECGSDVNGCGLSCGTCASGSTCQGEMGVCVETPVCDHNVPVCLGPYPSPRSKRSLLDAASAPRREFFCDSFCEWRDINEPLPDIVPNDEKWVMPTYNMQWRTFDSLSCALSEKCIFGSGPRLLLRFTTDIMNVGNGNFIGVDPYSRPDIVIWADCHQHNHMIGFARNDLFYLSNNSVAINSSKQSYCVEATARYQSGPQASCTTETSCSNQGLPPGWYDSYNEFLDCQWIDSTLLVERQALNQWYEYRVSVNNGRNIVEYSYINNEMRFPIFIPCAPSASSNTRLNEYIQANPSVCCTRPGGFDPITCPDPETIGYPGLCSSPPAATTCDYVIPAI